MESYVIRARLRIDMHEEKCNQINPATFIMVLTVNSLGNHDAGLQVVDSMVLTVNSLGNHDAGLQVVDRSL